MKEKRKWRRLSTVDVLFFLGAALISVGLGLWIAPPAGLVTAGAFSLAASFLSDDGKGGDGS